MHSPKPEGLKNLYRFMIEAPMNRRKFIGLAAAALSTGMLACAGPALTAENETRPLQSLPVGYPDMTLGGNTMNKKILVAYASANGSSGGVAQTIGQTLAESGAAVDVFPVKSVTSLDGYHSVVLGSAIHGGKWLPEAVDFLKANRESLRKLPTAFFLVCMLLAKPDAKNLQFVEQYLAEQQALVKPLGVGRFAGALFPAKHPLFSQLGLRIFLGYLGVAAGDYRSPDVIRNWAAGILPRLGG
jgi:menaquinone-dependent protoporphyrinogen oxidase